MSLEQHDEADLLTSTSDENNTASGASLRADADLASTSRLVLRLLLRRLRGFVGALLALVLLIGYLSVSQVHFLSTANVFNMLAGNSGLLLVATGLTFVLLTAGFDLSVGAMLATSGYVAAVLVNSGFSPLMVVLICVFLGVVLGGGVNGFLIGRIKLSFLVVTLGSSSLFFGLLKVITKGKTESISMAPGSVMYFIGNGRLYGIPIPVIISFGLVIIAGYVLTLTSYGRAIYAVGGNRDAARLAGINVTVVLVSVYAIAGVLAAIAGLIEVSRLSAASPTAGETIALTAGAAALLGGTSLSGGVGGIAGTVVGVLLIATLQNGFGLMGLSAYWKDVLTGAVLILAVLLDRIQARGS